MIHKAFLQEIAIPADNNHSFLINGAKNAGYSHTQL